MNIVNYFVAQNCFSYRMVYVVSLRKHFGMSYASF